MLDTGRGEMHVDAHVALCGVAEIRLDRHVGRSPLKRGDATIGDPAVAQVFVGAVTRVVRSLGKRRQSG